MRIAICSAYKQEFYADAPDDLRVGDVVYIKYAKDKNASAMVMAIGEYPDDDKVIQILLTGKTRKEILGKITMF